MGKGESALSISHTLSSTFRRTLAKQSGEVLSKEQLTGFKIPLVDTEYLKHTQREHKQGKVVSFLIIQLLITSLTFLLQNLSTSKPQKEYGFDAWVDNTNAPFVPRLPVCFCLEIFLRVSF